MASQFTDGETVTYRSEVTWGKSQGYSGWGQLLNPIGLASKFVHLATKTHQLIYMHELFNF